MKRLLSLLLVLALLVLPLTPRSAGAVTGGKLVALTFDDGPGRDTARLLDGLKERNTPCTFFFVGQQLQRFPDIAARAYREGHELANHTWDHPNLKKLSPERIREEIQSVNRLLWPICGEGQRILLRAPGGNTSPQVKEAVGTPLIYWSTNTADYLVLNAAKVADSLVSTCYDGAILLLHDIHATSVDAALAGIDRLKAQGYEFVTVSELFRRRGVALENGVSYASCRPGGTDPGPVQPPTLSTKTVGGQIEVTLTAQPGTEIRYSVDGSFVSGSSLLYTGPFRVTPPCTVQAASAFRWNGSRSTAVTCNLDRRVALQPEVKISGGTLTLTGPTAGTGIFCTLDGSVPTTSSPRYTGPISLSPGTQVRAICAGESFYTSPETRAVYTPNRNVFLDVFPESWYYGSVDRAVARGILQGTGGGRFQPERHISRGEAVTALWRLAGEPRVSGTSPFRDVKSGAWYAPALTWAASKGLVSVPAERKFRPEEPMKRQDLAVLLDSWLAAGTVRPPEGSGDIRYADGDTIWPACRRAVARVSGLGLMRGDDLGRFRPSEGASRAEAATVFLRLENLGGNSGT